MWKIIIDEAIKNKIEDIQAYYDFYSEIGGIVAGAFDTKEMCLRITDLSSPFPGDVKKRYRFLRKSTGHQELMDELWKKSGQTKAYLGEWHTHDQDIPIPSFVDKQTWKRISRRDNNFDQCCFIIIGRKAFRIWTVIDDEIVEQKGDSDE